MIRRLVAWTWPRRWLVADLAEMVEERNELRSAAIRRAKECEALRGELRRERQRFAALEHVGYAHAGRSRGWADRSCPSCRPVYLGPPVGGAS